jgi:predicted 3-demethylubiquinone-9 3-methyltransferase (glyoxalase superfamily)
MHGRARIARDVDRVPAGSTTGWWTSLLTRSKPVPRIKPFLWFDTQAEEAAQFYCSIFPNSRILNTSRSGEAGPGPAGSVMVVEFELDGTTFLALNGGPRFTFTEAISFTVECGTQAEIDHYWEKLSAGGRQDQCGWLKDRFGLSWQVVPAILGQLMSSSDPAAANRVMQAMLGMQKFDVAALQQASQGA